MQKHASWVVALIVGLAIGVVADRMIGGGAGGRRPEPPAAAANQPRPPARPQEDPKAVYRVPVGDSPVKGPADALVTIVEASDFECPFCKRVLPTLRQIEETYPGKVRFVFKHNPLPFHPRALPAAEAAEEARAEGGDARFWAMHDKLFESAPALERPNLEEAARALHVDVAALGRALDKNGYEARIRRDQALVTGLGANGTPTFFINGRKVAGAVPFEVFKSVIDEELRKAEEMVRAGTPAREVYDRIMDKAATAPVMVQGAAPSAPSAPPAPPPAQAAKVEIRPDDPVRGPAAAKVTIVEFSDFQCPFCGRVEPTLKRIEETWGKDVRIVWKHQPLPMHPQAMPAAEAAEAARQQGKFWQMHDLMFANQQELSPARYEAWARQVGLDLGKFQASVQANRGLSRIEEDSRLGNSVGANGTPTLFVNCRKIVGAVPFETFKPVVEEEIRKADELQRRGVKVDSRFYDRVCDDNVRSSGASAQVAPVPVPGQPVQVPLRPDDPARGPARAKVTIVEFSDFQCPFCGRVEPTLQQVEQAYGDKLRVVWKHQPLPMHPQALPAAEAAEAAREQGKFWQMHDKLFQNQQALTPDDLERLAQEIGLDMRRYHESVQGGRGKARIEEDSALAQRLGVMGTPTFFINGEKLVGAQPLDAFRAAIDRQLASVAQR